MPNIIITNICNQSCSYCFAHENMSDPVREKFMTIGLYLRVLKFLKGQNEEVRLLGWEPLLHPHIHTFLQLATRWEFQVIIFSNLNLPNKRVREIFKNIDTDWIRINVNINHPSFYQWAEWERLKENIRYLQSIGAGCILGYNLHSLSESGDFLFETAEQLGIYKINLKVTNSTVGSPLIIDTASRSFGTHLFDLISHYHTSHEIEVSCGLSPHVFDDASLEKLRRWLPNIQFGCEANAWKFDINVDGEIFRCFPLQWVWNRKLTIQDAIAREISSPKLAQLLRSYYIHSDGECSANRIIKASSSSNDYNALSN